MERAVVQKYDMKLVEEYVTNFIEWADLDDVEISLIGAFNKIVRTAGKTDAVKKIISAGGPEKVIRSLKQDLNNEFLWDYVFSIFMEAGQHGLLNNAIAQWVEVTQEAT